MMQRNGEIRYARSSFHVRKRKEAKLYVLSLRVSDGELIGIDETRGGKKVSDFMREAIEEKVIRERQAKIDGKLRGM